MADLTSQLPNLITIFEKTGKRLFFLSPREDIEYVYFIDFLCYKLKVLAASKFLSIYEMPDDRNEPNMFDSEVITKIFMRFGYTSFGAFSDIQKQLLNDTFQKYFGIGYPSILVKKYITNETLRLLEYQQGNNGYTVIIYNVENGVMTLDAKYFVDININSIVNVFVTQYCSNYISNISNEPLDVLLSEKVTSVSQILKEVQHRNKQALTLCAIRKFRHSLLSMFPKEIVRMIAKNIVMSKFTYDSLIK
ncbi:hypothetical protein Indivirus_7_10 [Indivirus ILV1]|uniref:Uncharacterized protein n=1 Tax=Indivirus ILV1 TaxID=1977633 RepID=A0A1V0SEE4_9VIRU|nr:hypothetical protein Indivirus_7_10 [Indivirus ILV1]